MSCNMLKQYLVLTKQQYRLKRHRKFKPVQITQFMYLSLSDTRKVWRFLVFWVEQFNQIICCFLMEERKNVKPEQGPLFRSKGTPSVINAILCSYFSS